MSPLKDLAAVVPVAGSIKFCQFAGARLVVLSTTRLATQFVLPTRFVMQLARSTKVTPFFLRMIAPHIYTLSTYTTLSRSGRPVRCGRRQWLAGYKAEA